MNLVVSHNTATGKVTCIFAGLDCEEARLSYEAAVVLPVTDATLYQWFRRPSSPMKRLMVQPAVAVATAPVAPAIEDDLGLGEPVAKTKGRK